MRSHDVVTENSTQHVDVDAIHAQALREHLLSNTDLYESRADFQEVRKFLDSYATSKPVVGKAYLYASAMSTPFMGFINVAHFTNTHTLAKLDSNYAYFSIDGIITRFPEAGKLTGDALSTIYFFKSRKEFDQFRMLLTLTLSDYKVTFKKID